MAASSNSISANRISARDGKDWRGFACVKRKRASQARPLSLDKAPLRMELVVTSFRNGRLDPLEFGLAELLVIATWFLHQQAPDEALASLLDSFRRLEFDRAAAGGEAFSETRLTFWLMVVRRFLETEGSKGEWQKDAGLIVRFYGHARRLPYRYYSATRWKSAEARYKWLLPDVRPFPERGRL